MKLHDCPANAGLLLPAVDLRSYASKITFGTNRSKATINVKTGNILIDTQYWRSLPTSSQLALLYHETAHLQTSGCANSCPTKPNGCERCADNRLGAQMKMSGYSEKEIADAVKRLKIKNRNTLVGDAIAGARAVK